MKRLLIDIDKLLDNKNYSDKIECEYLYHPDENKGYISLIEIAEFAAYCRQCKHSHCVDACPKEALERTEQGTIKRYNMRCVGCKSCILACPFGTIFPEAINYVTSKCDYCLNQLLENPDYIPLCVKTAPDGCFQMTEIEKEDPKNNIFFVGKYLAIKTYNWRFKEEKI